MQSLLINDVSTKFFQLFKNKPILIFSPGRINIIGEHTDYNDGFVFPAAVNKGIVAAIQNSDTNYSTAYALDLDNKIEFDLNNLKPSKSGSWENYVFGVIAEIKKKNKEIGNFNLVFKGNIPVGSGLSSSAALENSIVFGLNTLFNLGFTKQEMILISQKAEHNFVGVKCGIMDQYASMFGIKNHALLLDCRTMESKPYQIDFKNHQLMLINTNVKHSLSDSAYNDRRTVCENVCKILGVHALRDATVQDLETIKDKLTPNDYQKALYVIEENCRVLLASKAIENSDLDALGLLLFQSHSGLQHQYKVSCEELDFLVDQAKLSQHVLGARMMGGGFGGCTINLVDRNFAKEFSEITSKAYQKTFGKSCSIYNIELSEGTHLIE
ncbi:galactokinase [Sabulilitoribacter multivorans]|uniref:Galactokinase n=1 Tax=Flaviramulus multivorans TaxID=1304750 RepID=A0ABS9II77_9FLAO|nr:galactokinase [Flaviramulus multivorans]MCF7560135.1 galactokinase [Flaviramulus multivorans]